MSYIRTSFLAAAAALMLLALARAEDRPDATHASHLNRILESGTVRVGTTGDFPPMTSRDPDSKSYVGYDIDAGTELAKDLGVQVQFVPADWKTLINGMVADKYDIVMSGVSMSVDRAKVAGFTQPYMEFGTVPVLRKESADRFQELGRYRPEGSHGCHHAGHGVRRAGARILQAGDPQAGGGAGAGIPGGTGRPR